MALMVLRVPTMPALGEYRRLRMLGGSSAHPVSSTARQSPKRSMVPILSSVGKGFPRLANGGQPSPGFAVISRGTRPALSSPQRGGAMDEIFNPMNENADFEDEDTLEFGLG